MNIPKEIEEIYTVFHRYGKNLFIVGGAVRDFLMNKTPKDFDLATDSLPDNTQSMLERHGWKTVEVGKTFGIIVAVSKYDKNEQYEIATFRKDDSAGRRPDSITFTNLENDANRRDLTINALYFDIGKKKIIDTVGGIDDIKNKKIKTVGNAINRFDEDPLRKLRALRFAGRFGSKLDSDIEKSLLDNNSLTGVSAERVYAEFKSAIKTSKSAKYYLLLCKKFKLFHYIFDKLKVNEKFLDCNVFEVQCALLLRDNKTSDINSSLNKLKYTAKDIMNVLYLVTLYQANPESLFLLKKMQSNLSIKRNDIILYLKLLNKPKLIKYFDYMFKINSQDLIRKGFKGKELGDKMKELELKTFMKYNK